MKVAIVIGASQGIGAGVADAFARAGYAVVGTSRSIATLASLTKGGLNAVTRSLATDRSGMIRP